MEILTKLNTKEKAEINFNDIRQRDSRQVELSKEEIGRLIARYNSGIKDKKNANWYIDGWQREEVKNDDFKQKINGGFIWNIYDVHIAEEVMEMMIKF